MCCHANTSNNLYLFNDLSRIAPDKRVAQSPIIQFYYGGGNIGDCFSVLGIQKMLGVSVDTWSVNDNNIDFNFINKNYACAIIVGGGLFHGAFLGFLKKLEKECTIPMIAWGIGACLPEQRSGHKRFKNGVDKKLVQAIIKKCDLVNIRDSLTATFYE